jgi:hypothetical protein
MKKEGAPEGNTNAVKHGAYAFRDHGEQALEPSGRSRLVELREIVQDKPRLLALVQEETANTVMLFEIVQSYVAQEVKKGVPLAEIPALKTLPAFANTMQRALANLWAIMPGDNSHASAELQHILEVIENHDKDAK